MITISYAMVVIIREISCFASIYALMKIFRTKFYFKTGYFDFDKNLLIKMN